MTQKTDTALKAEINNPTAGTRENRVNWFTFLKNILIDIVDSKANISETDRIIFIQDDAPDILGPWMWVQTNYNGVPGAFTIWIDDGVIA